MFVMIGKVEAIQINPTTFAPARFGTVGSILSLTIPLLYILALLVLLAVGIYGAFTILQAGDDPEKLQKAKQTFQWAVVGVVVIFASYMTVKILGVVFNIDVPL